MNLFSPHWELAGKSGFGLTQGLFVIATALLVAPLVCLLIVFLVAESVRPLFYGRAGGLRSVSAGMGAWLTFATLEAVTSILLLVWIYALLKYLF